MQRANVQASKKTSLLLWSLPGCNPKSLERAFQALGPSVKVTSEPTLRQAVDDVDAQADYVFSSRQAFALNGHHPPELNADTRTTHAFLIRDPRRMNGGLSSPNDESGYKEQLELYQFVKNHVDPSPLVIDVDELQANPSATLLALTTHSDFPFSVDMLEPFQHEPHFDESSEFKPNGIAPSKPAGPEVEVANTQPDLDADLGYYAELQKACSECAKRRPPASILAMKYR